MNAVSTESTASALRLCERLPDATTVTFTVKCRDGGARSGSVFVEKRSSTTCGELRSTSSVK